MMEKTERKAVCSVLIVRAADAKKLKNELEQLGMLDKKFRIWKSDDNADQVAIPIIREKLDACKHRLTSKEFMQSEMMMPFSKSHMIKSDFIYKNLLDAILDEYYAKTNQSIKDEFLKNIPKSWQIYGDLLILPKNSMTEAYWKDTLPDVLHVFCRVLNVNRIARHSSVANDLYRSPKLDLLLGDNGWVKRKDNGITYTYDITKCMFSDGNITEKIRLASLNCEGETVVDLFAGIGYFVLPFLVHAKAKLVYACEWNPDAVEALRKNLEINGVDNKCIILEGDNKKVAPTDVADRVNLGLIPSSEGSWYTACAALKAQSGGWLHIHANVDCKPQLKGAVEAFESKSRMELNDSDCVASTSFDGTGDDDNHKTQLGVPSSAKTNDSSNGTSTESRYKSLTCDKEVDVIKTTGMKKDLCNIFGYEDSSQMLKDKCQEQRVSSNSMKKDYWNDWAHMKAATVQSMLINIHKDETIKNWQCAVRHIEHVKSYAPHVDHIVIDLECRPLHFPNE